MKKWLLTPVLLLSATSFLRAQDPADKVVASLVKNGQGKVAVLPIVVSRRGDVESTTGELGARSPLMSKELYKKLVSASQQGQYKGKFTVVPERNVRLAIKSLNFSVNDLGNADKVKQIGKATGAKSLAVLTHDEEGMEKEGIDIVNTELVATEDNFATYSQDFAEEVTLAKAAYGGESWELRRWEGDELKNVGIDLDGNKAFGKSTKWESYQYKQLKKDLPHPRDIADFPYLMNVLVDGKVRQPKAVNGVHGKQYVVELNPGEVYQIEIENQGKKPVFVALYVDGVTTIDKMFAEPEDLELHRHWFLKADSGKRKIMGWHVIERDAAKKPTKTQYFDEFKVVPRVDSVAAGLGGDVEIGMITAVYYTVGMDGITQPSDDELLSKSLPVSSFGTGTGERKERALEFPTEGQKPRGIILGAQTLYYRTGEQLKGILDGTSEEDLAMTSPDVEKP